MKLFVINMICGFILMGCASESPDLTYHFVTYTFQDSIPRKNYRISVNQSSMDNYATASITINYTQQSSYPVYYYETQLTPQESNFFWAELEKIKPMTLHDFCGKLDGFDYWEKIYFRYYESKSYGLGDPGPINFDKDINISNTISMDNIVTKEAYPQGYQLICLMEKLRKQITPWALDGNREWISPDLWTMGLIIQSGQKLPIRCLRDEKGTWYGYSDPPIEKENKDKSDTYEVK